MTYITHIKKFFKGLSKKQLIWSAVGILAIGGIVSAALGGEDTVVLVKAERGTVEEEVLVTGKTVSKSEANLGFERGGKVAEAYVQIGSSVREGQRLIVLNQADVLADLRKAKADLHSAEVELDSITRSTAIDYESAEDNAVAALRDAYAAADDAVHNDADTFFNNPRGYAVLEIEFESGSSNYTFAVDSTLEREVNRERRALEPVFEDFKAELSSLNNKSDIEQAFVTARMSLEQTSDFLTDLAAAINSISTNEFQYQSTIAGYKTAVGNARTQVSSALTDVLEADERLENAQGTAGNSGTEFDSIRAQEARVESLKADIAGIEADLSKTVLVAPISGVVTQMDAERGEIVSSGVSVVSIISDSELKIEANVSEVNIGKIARGNSVTISFDAFPGEDMVGVVSYIDPGAVIIDGVPTYKVTISFAEGIDMRLRSGLSANLRIMTDAHVDVVKVPAYAVSEKDGKEYVTVKIGEKDTEVREVTTGLRGKDGSVEIVSGLSVGEELVIVE